MRLVLAVLALLSVVGVARADRFPQPVRAGDLVGRTLIGPTEAQQQLGRVEGVDRLADGDCLRIRTASLLPWHRRTVEVKIADVALLGELVALTGLTQAQLEALPEAPAAAPVPADAMLRIGLARPFH